MIGILLIWGVPITVFLALPSSPLWWRSGRFIAFFLLFGIAIHFKIQTEYQRFETCYDKTHDMNDCLPFQAEESIMEYLKYAPVTILYMGFFELVWRLVYIRKLTRFLLGMGDEWISNLLFWFFLLLVAIISILLTLSALIKEFNL